MGRFVRVTELFGGEVHWINLDHVRQLIVRKPNKHWPVQTSIQIDGGWGEKFIEVSQTPEEILVQSELDQAEGNSPPANAR